MKNLFSKIKKITFALIAFTLPVVSHAQGGTQIQNPIGVTSIRELIANLLDAVVKIGSVLLVFFIIYSGFLYVKAQGNPANISKAHAALLWTAVGGLIILGAYVIGQVIESTISEVTNVELNSFQ